MAVTVMFVVVAIMIPCIIGLLHRCPSTNNNFIAFYSHCTCTKQQSKVNVTCQGITTDELLTLRLMDLRNYAIDDFTIRRSGSSLTLGSSPFRKLNIHRLIFEDVTFTTIPIFRAFSGLDFTLEELHFIRCNVSLWSWGEGRNFVHLKTVHFEDTRLPETLTYDSVLKYFPNNIRKLQINGCSVTTLGDEAFKKLSHLESLELNRNRIRTIQRSMFPSSARRLKYISLIDNPLTSISDDTFVDMTRLEFLLLSNTRLTSLRNETFFPVWDQLEEIYFNNIRMSCDCDSKWMLHVPDFKTFRAPFCRSRRRTLDQLAESELCGGRRR